MLLGEGHHGGGGRRAGGNGGGGGDDDYDYDTPPLTQVGMKTHAHTHTHAQQHTCAPRKGRGRAILERRPCTAVYGRA